MRMSSQRQPKHMRKVAPKATSYRVVIPIAAFALVAGLGQAALVPTTVFAEEAETTAVEQAAVDPTPTNGEAISVTDGSTQSYTGDVATTVTDGGVTDGVHASGSDVTLDGSVDLSSTSDATYGVDARYGSSVVVTGDVSNEAEYGQGVSAFNSSTVEVGGNVDATMIGVNADNATVNVGGNVTATDEDYSVGVMVEQATVVVGGDVASPVTGAEITLYPGESQATLVVEGTISGGQTGLSIHAYTREGADVSSLAQPIIVTKAITTPTDGVVIRGIVEDEDNYETTDMTEAQLSTYAKAINYIVDPGDNEIVSGTTTATVNGVTYTVAHEGDSVVLRRPDGSTFSVTVARGTGFDLNAIAAAAATTSSKTTATATSNENTADEADKPEPVKTASIKKATTRSATALPQTSDDSASPFVGGMVLLVGAAAIGAGAAMRRRSSEE